MSGCSEPKNLLPDPERFLIERFGFGVVPDLLEKEPEVIQGSAVSGCSGPRTRFATSTALSAMGIAS